MQTFKISSPSACVKFIEALSLISLLLISCTPSSDNILYPEDSTQAHELHDVNLSFTSSDFNITTRTGSSEIPETLNRLTLSVFSGTPAEEIATLTQKRESLNEGETFGNFSLKLPLGTYTFVAVLHEVPSDKTELSPATITSPTLATLPSSSICDTYCCAHQKSITADASQSLILALGTRINAAFRLETFDKVPSDVTSIGIYVNRASSTTVPSQPTFNPTTGLATADWKYVKNLTATPGQKFNRAFSILLSEDIKDVGVRLIPQPVSDTYPALDLTGVTLQRNHITHARGYLFNHDVTPGFTLDTSLGSDIPYDF